MTHQTFLKAIHLGVPHDCFEHICENSDSVKHHEVCWNVCY